MRLRYLRVGKYPPIKDVEILFASGSPLQRECAIRFVVGVNGSGKSNLLRAIAEVFISLADGRLPMFPVQVIYELGERDSASHRTLILDCMEKRASASLWLGENYICPDSATTEQFADVFECLRSNSPTIPPQFRPLIAKGEWPTSAVTPTPIALPTTVLAYTTGDTKPWQSIWSRNQNSGEGNSTNSNDNDNGEERPAGWTLDKEMLIHSDEIVESDDTQLETSSSEASPDDLARPVLLTKELLKCALLAVALSDAVREESDTADPTLSEQRALLKESLARGGWQELVSVAFRCRLQPSVWKDRLHMIGVYPQGRLLQNPTQNSTHAILGIERCTLTFEGSSMDRTRLILTCTIVPHKGRRFCSYWVDAKTPPLNYLSGSTPCTKQVCFMKSSFFCAVSASLIFWQTHSPRKGTME